MIVGWSEHTEIIFYMKFVPSSGWTFGLNTIDASALFFHALVKNSHLKRYTENKFIYRTRNSHWFSFSRLICLFLYSKFFYPVSKKGSIGTGKVWLSIIAQSSTDNIGVSNSLPTLIYYYREKRLVCWRWKQNMYIPIFALSFYQNIWWLQLFLPFLWWVHTSSLIDCSKWNVCGDGLVIFSSTSENLGWLLVTPVTDKCTVTLYLLVLDFDRWLYCR